MYTISYENILNNLTIQREGTTLIQRKKYIDLITPHLHSPNIKLLSGQRKVGKSSILQHFAEKHPDINNVLMINFEQHHYPKILTYTGIKTFFEDYFLPLCNKKLPLLIILDEIQELQDRPLFVSYLKSLQNFSIDILISSSTSGKILSLLQEEFPDQYIDFLILPFLYEEYPSLFGDNTPSRTLNEYLTKTGLPEPMRMITQRPNDLIQTYFSALENTIIVEDIIKLHGAKDVVLVKQLFRVLIANIGKIISPNALSNRIIELGIPTNHNTITQYIHYLLGSYIVFAVECMDLKTNEMMKQKKYFLNDLGFINYSYLQRNLSTKTRLVNYFHLCLLDQNVDFYGGKIDEREIDFVIKQGSDRIAVKFFEGEKNEHEKKLFRNRCQENNIIGIEIQDEKTLFDAVTFLHNKL